MKPAGYLSPLSSIIAGMVAILSQYPLPVITELEKLDGIISRSAALRRALISVVNFQQKSAVWALIVSLIVVLPHKFSPQPSTLRYK